ncbi:MAG: hypothetical protein ABIP34_06760 [Rhodoferax sp.]|uniref:hypothetical protein n=1 Tax=Rhodoferax sp. TaxID=50421 RepID=UPI003267C5EB
MKRLIYGLLFAATSLLASAAGAQELGRDTQGRIEFNSFTPKTMFDLALVPASATLVDGLLALQAVQPEGALNT